MRPFAAILLALGFAGAIAAGCGGSQKTGGGSYAKDAQAAYEVAMIEFRDDDCMEAEPLFRDIRRKFAYSRFAPLAELRLADCYFMDDKFTEAIQAYRQFVRNRPSHSEVPYARFRIAESYYEQIPSDWFLIAPAEEKDQDATREALRELRRFVLDYTEDPRAKKAAKMAQEAMTLLGRHEFYVAEFYYKRDHYRAAISRLNRLLTAYPGTAIEPEALLMLGESFLEIGDKARAKQAFQRLWDEYPSSDEASDARSDLGT